MGAAGEIGVVANEGVALVDLAARIGVQHRFDAPHQRSQMERDVRCLRDEAPTRIEQGNGAVLPFFYIRREGSPDERVAHFLRDGQQPVAEDFQLDGIGKAPRGAPDRRFIVHDAPPARYPQR